MTASRIDVAVIGAGVAGLAAASALAEAGQRVLVLEARGELGGRATAFVDSATGELVDNGQHVLFGCYHETFAFFRRVGADAHVRVQPTLEVPYLDPGGRRSVLKCPLLPSPLHLLGAILDWDALPWSDRLRALRLAAPLLRARRNGIGSAAGDETVSQWLTRYGQRGRLREWLWEPLAIAALNQSPSEAAAAPFLRVLALMFGPDPKDASLALPTRPLHDMYARPARRFIESHGGEVRTHALARVRLVGHRVSGVEVRRGPQREALGLEPQREALGLEPQREALGPEQIDVNRVIAAVPWFALRPLFTGASSLMDSTVAAASRMTSKPIVTVNLWYDRAVMEDVFVGLPGRAMQWVFDKRQAFGERASHLSLVSSGADDLVGLDHDALVTLAAREVAESIPGARDALLRRGTVIREKHATFSLAPGQPPRPPVETPVEGLFLAGDWIDTGLPGTIESAALAGHRAAAAVLRPPSSDHR